MWIIGYCWYEKRRDLGSIKLEVKVLHPGQNKFKRHLRRKPF